MCASAAALLYGGAVKYSTAEAQYNLPAHVFEEVEISPTNAKQDLSGLRSSLRQSSLLLTVFHNWEFGNVRHEKHKATDYKVTG